LKNKTAQGFTLVELLVVIAIIAILAAVVVLIINPLELTRRGRDAARLTDLANLQQAINVAVQEATDSAEQILCSEGLTGGVCTAKSSTGGRNSNGTGWVKVNLSAQTSVSVSTLPVDPTNSDGATGYHYTYCSDGSSWEINSKLESQQQSGKMSNDGGDDTTLYEVGSKAGLDLIQTDGTPCAYN
jgi:prepilin-type N-terminal cleavage/methylation domain-containing protein